MQSEQRVGTGELLAGEPQVDDGDVDCVAGNELIVELAWRPHRAHVEAEFVTHRGGEEFARVRAVVDE